MRRIVELDAIRGMAALAVLMGHMHAGVFGAWPRVDLFLVLSGFLTTSLVLGRKTDDRFLRDLYRRRAIRIWPLYFAAMAMVAAFNPFLNRPFPLQSVGYHLTFTQNLSRYWGTTPGVFSSYFQHTWTLAVIEQFHLVWPMALMIAGSRRIVPIAVGFALVAPLMRLSGLHPWLLLARCEGLMFGSLLAIALRTPHGTGWSVTKRRLAMIGLMALGLALPFVVPGWARAPRSFDDNLLCSGLVPMAGSITYTGLIGLVVLGAGSRALAPLRSRSLVTLGALSYALYLLHPLTIVASGRILRSVVNPPVWLLDLVVLASCLMVAALGHHLIERPIGTLSNRGRDRSAASPRSQAIVIGAS